MPQTITISDPRYRTKSIVIDLNDPDHYIVTVKREIVKDEMESGKVYSREEGITIREEIHFDGGYTPRGNPILLNLLAPIQNAINELSDEYNEAGSNGGSAAPSNPNEVFGDIPVTPE